MRQLIPALLLLTLLLPAAAAAQSPVTRAQFVAALWTCSGAVPYDANGPFSDVNPNSPGATAVAWAYDLGIVRGTGGTLFVPDRPITREEAAVLLRRYAVHLGRDTFLPSGVAACNDFEGGDSLFLYIKSKSSDCNIKYKPGSLFAQSDSFFSFLKCLITAR